VLPPLLQLVNMHIEATVRSIAAIPVIVFFILFEIKLFENYLFEVDSAAFRLLNLVAATKSGKED
jgi:hypothetical protein